MEDCYQCFEMRC